MTVTLQLESDRAYRQLLELILGGSIDPEAPLSERKLAETLGIGRTPVREALRDLARDGVVDVLPARGTFVRQLSLEDVKNIYEVRHALEGMAAETVARRGVPDELSAYGPQFRAMLERPAAFDTAEIYHVGATFHLDICRATGNGQLVGIYEPLRLRFRAALGLPQHYDQERVHRSVAEHLDILDAIERGDGATARRLISEHLDRGFAVRARIYSELVGAGATENAKA